ncbi:MAG: phage tail tape measure protein, partial [Cyanobacteria bacterium J06554_11]
MTVVGSVELDVGIRRASVDSAINGLRRRFAGLDELDIGVQVNRQALASEAARIERAFQDVDSRITPDVDTRSVSRASAVVTGIFQGIGQQVTSILTDAIARGIRSAVNVPVASVGLFAELDTALVQFESRARGSVSSSEELARVSALVADEAERIGIETSKTPQEVARIATRMVELGASAEEAAGNVDGVVAALEATGFTDIDKTAKAFQAGANIFGETSDDLADKIALLASSTAVTSATDIEQAFGKAGGQFRATGQSVDALLAIFAKFRETSEPEVAATSTRNALQKLIPSTDRARAALADLGVSLFDDSGDALPIIDVLEQLEQRVSGLTDRQASNVLLQIFDARSASQIQLLLGGLDDVRSTFNALENDSAGFAQSATDSLNQGVNAAVNRLGGSLTTLGTKFGEALGGGRGGPIELAIRGTQDAINQIIEAVNTQDLFGNIQESVGNLSSALGSVFSADNFADGLISALNIVDVAISNVVNNLADFIETNPGALANLAERIGAIGRIALDVGSALINASFAIAGFFEQSGINDAVTQALTGVAGAISLIADRISSVNTDELVRIAPVAAAAAVAIGKLVQVSQVVPNLIRSAASGLSNFFNNLDTFAESEGLIGGAAQVFLSLKDAVSAAVEAGQGIINVFSPAIDLFVNSGIAGIQAFLSAAQSLAEPFINAAAAVLNFTANAAFQEITKRLQQAEELAKDVKAFVGAVDAVDAPDFASGASDSVDLATASITQGFENIAEQRVAIDEAANSEELENFEELQSEKAAAQEKALNEFKDASTAAIREIESEQAEVLRSIGEQQLSGADPGQLALARIDAEREAANQIIAERERQLSALKEAEAAGTIAADAA